MAKTQAKAGYSAKDITVLEGLEPVRLRPGMYIGSTGLRGLHHLVEEIVVNSVDEALAGYNDSIEITIHPDNSVTVRDRGRGIPVDVVEGTGTSALEVIMTKLHAGGKFGGDGYKVSGGLHGVGASVVNALSEWLVVEVSRDSKVYRQEFDRGVPRGPMQIVGESTENGTTTTFLADAEIFDETVYDATTIVSRFREMAFLTRGLRITFTDERAGAEPPVEFHYEGGIKDYVSYINESKDSCIGTSSTSRPATTRARSKSRCSGTRRTRSRSSPSPTTSTRTRAARTSPASGRRSPRRSTSTRATRGC